MSTTGDPAGHSPALLEVLGQGQSLGYIGDGSLDPHLRHGAAFAVAVGALPGRALDLGSGGGLPGLALAESAWTTTQLTLVDAGQQRAQFLEDAVRALDLAPRVQVRRGRAEVLGRDPAMRGAYDVVVARAFGAPAVVAECAVGFLRVDGLLVVSEPPADTEMGSRWDHDDELLQLGLVRDGLVEVGGWRFQRLRASMACPDRFPRRDGVPTKRPLFS